MSEYRYDIFISVRTEHIFNRWVEETFVPIFRGYIKEDAFGFLKRDATLFYYRESLKPGDSWPEDLKDAVQTSRVALALCSPRYFHSRWCVSEFKSFRKRHELAGATVLVPIAIHDGDSFPDWVMQEIQVERFDRFVVLGEGFQRTPVFLDFQEAVKKLSLTVADRIKNAPPFREWPLVEEGPIEPEPPVKRVRM